MHTLPLELQCHIVALACDTLPAALIARVVSRVWCIELCAELVNRLWFVKCRFSVPMLWSVEWSPAVDWSRVYREHCVLMQHSRRSDAPWTRHVRFFGEFPPPDEFDLGEVTLTVAKCEFAHGTSHLCNRKEPVPGGWKWQGGRDLSNTQRDDLWTVYVTWKHHSVLLLTTGHRRRHWSHWNQEEYPHRHPLEPIVFQWPLEGVGYTLRLRPLGHNVWLRGHSETGKMCTEAWRRLLWQSWSKGGHHE